MQTQGSKEGTGVDENNAGVSNNHCHAPTGHLPRAHHVLGITVSSLHYCQRCLTLYSAHTTLGGEYAYAHSTDEETETSVVTAISLAHTESPRAMECCPTAQGALLLLMMS